MVAEALEAPALGGAPRGELTLSSGVGDSRAWPQEDGAPETSGTPLPSLRACLPSTEQMASEAFRATFLDTRHPVGLDFLSRT